MDNPLLQSQDSTGSNDNKLHILSIKRLLFAAQNGNMWWIGTVRHSERVTDARLNGRLVGINIDCEDEPCPLRSYALLDI